MSEKTYINHRERLVDELIKTAMESMKMAGEEEKQLAVERNELINGISYITVVADGSWMKRSYGSVYDSSSSVGAIIGFCTGKVLFIGIRNKYCTVCNLAERKDKKIRKHKCYRNFDRNASSTSMESDAIAEGFKNSLQMHGLMYKTVVADGDSSVYQSILNNAPYGEMNVIVQKIECTNYLLRNLCKKLKAVAETTQPKMHRQRSFVQLRNVVKNNILKIRKEVLQVAAVQREKREPHHIKAKKLQKIILNNTQQVLTQVHKYMGKNVPAVVANLEERRQIKVAKTRECREIDGRQKRFKREAGTNCHYDPHSQKPDLPSDVFEQLQKNHFEKLLENAKNRDKIECETRSQNDCELWQSLRRQMLTASNFGIVCRLRPTTSCAATVKNILFPPSIDTVAMKYGRQMEEVAKQQLAASLKKDIKPCGLFIDYEYPYLGASPDGLLDEDGLVEIKCPLSAENLTAEQAIKTLPQLKNVCQKNPNKMNEKHRFFYQVQGQLSITQRDYCIFAVWTPKSLRKVHLNRDDVFWKGKMLPFLTRFYHECMLPEIVDSRHNRHMSIRELSYI